MALLTISPCFGKERTIAYSFIYSTFLHLHTSKNNNHNNANIDDCDKRQNSKLIGCLPPPVPDYCCVALFQIQQRPRCAEKDQLRPRPRRDSQSEQQGGSDYTNKGGLWWLHSLISSPALCMYLLRSFATYNLEKLWFLAETSRCAVIERISLKFAVSFSEKKKTHFEVNEILDKVVKQPLDGCPVALLFV